ncbi:hypothetical protein B0T10DRAFT_66470 [Thelonectria olida]|uniref:Uncharacterized protein n=1 Tax=Thelonectria olida TaxID=1576542 RepID=A0A9P8W219_9HYPO|nr:hypothetical protein B0T10DRAFT_66470 [Thelonectria olida]
MGVGSFASVAFFASQAARRKDVHPSLPRSPIGPRNVLLRHTLGGLAALQMAALFPSSPTGEYQQRAVEVSSFPSNCPFICLGWRSKVLALARAATRQPFLQLSFAAEKNKEKKEGGVMEAEEDKTHDEDGWQMASLDEPALMQVSLRAFSVRCRRLPFDHCICCSEYESSQAWYY